MAKYVKFLRGTPEAYANLAVKSPDTLYFISAVGSSTGSLYLGSKLISGDATSTVAGNIADLGDIEFTELKEGDILVYNADSGKWVNAASFDLFDLMQGATAEENGVAGLVPTPMAGEEELFLKGDGTWAKPIEDSAIKDIALAALTEALIPENAQESLDTLQEIADWIQKYPSDAAEMNTSITNLETRVINIENTTLQMLEWGELEPEVSE